MTRPAIFAILALFATLTTTANADDARLLQAVADRDTAAVHYEALLRADVDVTDEYGNTALMIASAYGYTDVVAILVDAGADVNATGRIGNTALIVAVQGGHAGVTEKLLEAGAVVDTDNEYGINARRLAAGHGQRDITALLDQVPVEVTLNTPLMAF